MCLDIGLGDWWAGLHLWWNGCVIVVGSLLFGSIHKVFISCVRHNRLPQTEWLKTKNKQKFSFSSGGLKSESQGTEGTMKTLEKNPSLSLPRLWWLSTILGIPLVCRSTTLISDSVVIWDSPWISLVSSHGFLIKIPVLIGHPLSQHDLTFT